MFRRTLKILQQMLQDFETVSDHLGALCIKGLNIRLVVMLNIMFQNSISAT